jgi:hypothetical protein
VTLRPTRFLAAIVAGCLIVACLSVATPNLASASTCGGGGTAKTTWLDTWVTEAETRTVSYWNFDCTWGNLWGPSGSGQAYYNGAGGNCMSLAYNGPLSYLQNDSTYVHLQNYDNYSGYNSCLFSSSFGFQLYNSVATNSSDFGNYRRYCGVTNTWGDYPSSVDLNCAAW